MSTPHKSSQSWAGIGFEVEITGDGSPSLRLLQGDGTRRESMHHSGGAAEETELIYGQVIRRCFQQIASPHFISVGLGLGYIELCVAREALLKQNSDFTDFTLESFEIVPELKEYFLQWLKGEELSPEVAETYDQVLRFVLKEVPLSPLAVKKLLLQKKTEGQWLLCGALEEKLVFNNKAHGVLFDAFSAKTTPVLWTEEFLTSFFEKATAEDALLSTYASRTSLKKALKAAGFVVEIREGFKGKRNSTLGLKGLFQATFFEAPAETSSRTQ